MKARGNQPTAGLISTCPQIELKDNQSTLEVMYGQHVKSPIRFWVSILGPLLKLVTTQIPHNAGLATVHSAWNGKWDYKVRKI
jgi:hypothetical protein